MTVTDEQFAKACRAVFIGPIARTDAEQGRAMLAALEAHGCIPQQQGLTVRQELVARLVIGLPDESFTAICNLASDIIALGDPQ